MRRHRKKTLIQALTLILSPAGALAQDVDVSSSSNGFRINGAAAGDFSGISISGAGDVNGDGLADLIIGADRADPNGNDQSGSAFVVFGKRENSQVELEDLGNQGFRINGEDVDDRFSTSVSGAGDVNGDGLDDVIIGSPAHNAGGLVSAGRSYVVFGKPSFNTVESSNLGSQGFQINGAAAANGAGFSVSGAGDVNGDGLADVIIGAPLANPGGLMFAGAAYVVFGKPDTALVELANLATGGFRIDGASSMSNLGFSASGAGDVNGDGLDDVIVGAPGANMVGDESRGAAYVVFGKPDSDLVDLANIASDGFAIDGGSLTDNTGYSVSAAGDVNGDGLADLIVGSPGRNLPSFDNAGAGHVIYGKRQLGALDLGNLTTEGFAIIAAEENAYTGSSVASAADVNGDGLTDPLIGISPDQGSMAGGAYVTFGNPIQLFSIDLINLGASGYRIFEENSTGGFGFRASGAGDVNGDGLADVVVGAPASDPNELTNAGSSYVFFSEQTPPSQASYRRFARNGNPPELALGVLGDGSNASHPDSRAWIDLDQVSTIFAEIRVTLTRNANAFAEAAASVSWRFFDLGPFPVSAEVTFRYLDEELINNSNENLLRVVHSADGLPPFTWLTSVVEPQTNKISATVDQLGYFYIGQVEEMLFADSFE